MAQTLQDIMNFLSSGGASQTSTSSPNTASSGWEGQLNDTTAANAQTNLGSQAGAGYTAGVGQAGYDPGKVADYNTWAASPQGQTAALPTQQVTAQNAPVYSTSGVTNSGPMDSALKDTLTSNGQGSISGGVGAFMGGGFQPIDNENIGSVNGGNTYLNNGKALASLSNTFGLGGTSGINTNPYANDPTEDQTNQLYNQLQGQLSNYYNIGGLSQGWDGSSNAMSDRSTMYMNNGQGSLIPVSGSQSVAPSVNNGYMKSEAGQQLLSALSVVAPAFGGAAGIIGEGAAGTVEGAGGGLGLTSGLGSYIGNGAASALGNAAVSGVTGGLPGAVGSLVGSAGNAALGSMMGGATTLGSMFGAGGVVPGSTLNPMASFSSGLNGIGLGGSPLGMIGAAASGAAGGTGISANSLGQAGVGLAGSYAANKFLPGAGGVGNMAGKSLYQLLTGT